MDDKSAGSPPPPNWYPAPQVPVPPGPPPSPGLPPWLSVASLVVSAVSLLGLVGVLLWLALVGGPLTGGGESTLTGQVPAMSTSGPLPGPELARVVGDVIEHDGAEAALMTCPDTPRLDQGVVTVCHGTIDAEGWAVVVYFETKQGLFTLQPV